MNSIDTLIFQISLQHLTLYKSPVHRQIYEVTMILLDLGRKAPETKMQKHLLCIPCQALKKRREINYKYIYASLKLGFLHLALNFCHFSRYYAKWGYFTTSVPLLPLPKWVLGPDHVQVYCSWKWIGKIFYKKNYSSLYL